MSRTMEHFTQAFDADELAELRDRLAECDVQIDTQQEVIAELLAAVKLVEGLLAHDPTHINWPKVRADLRAVIDHTAGDEPC